MNIHTKTGSKVKYIAENGYDHDLEHANRYLEKGKLYTVSYIDIGNWCTDVYLEEIPTQCFNSVHFKNVK